MINQKNKVKGLKKNKKVNKKNSIMYFCKFLTEEEQKILSYSIIVWIKTKKYISITLKLLSNAFFNS